MSPLPDAPQPKWYHSVWFVLLMLFVVLGPFGLPFLWNSPRFPRWVKIVLTGVALLYTYWLIASTIWIVRIILRVFPLSVP